MSLHIQQPLLNWSWFAWRGCKYFRPHIFYGWNPYVGSICKPAGWKRSNSIAAWVAYELGRRVTKPVAMVAPDRQQHGCTDRYAWRKVTVRKRDPAVSLTLRLKESRRQRPRSETWWWDCGVQFEEVWKDAGTCSHIEGNCACCLKEKKPKCVKHA